MALTPQKPPAKILRVLGPKDQPTWERALVGIYDYLDALTSMAFQQSVINNTPVIITGGAPTGPAIASLGAPGADGADGEEGSLGPPGPTGKTGIQGVAGLPGTVGAPGTDGEDGDEGAPGVPGLTGPRGPTGTAGSAGPPGSDGEGEGDSLYPTSNPIAWPPVGQIVISTGLGPTGESLLFHSLSTHLTTAHHLELTASGGTGIAISFTRAADQYLDKSGSGDLGVGTSIASRVGFYTNNVYRLLLDASGNLQLPHYTTQGHLDVDSSGNVTSTAYPLNGRVMVSDGTSPGASTGDFTLLANELQIGQAISTEWMNATGVNYERVRAFWSANVWNLKSEKSGAGTARQILIDGDTADASMHGATIGLTSTGLISIQGGSVTVGLATLNIVMNSTRMSVLYQPIVATSASATLDAAYWSLGATFTGSTNITTASGVNAFTIPTPSYTGTGFAITNAASFTVKDAPTPTGGMTITNPYAVWVQAGGTRLDGNVGFCGAQPAARQTVTGSRGGNAALASVIAALSTNGLITDSSTP